MMTYTVPRENGSGETSVIAVSEHGTVSVGALPIGKIEDCGATWKAWGYSPDQFEAVFLGTRGDQKIAAATVYAYHSAPDPGSMEP